MPEDLASLRLRHRGRSSKIQCASCQQRATEARIIVQVYELAGAGGARGKQVISKTRSLCTPCTVRIFDGIVDLLPDEGAH